MEKPILKKVVHKREDRNVLAAKYLAQLKKSPPAHPRSRSVLVQRELKRKKEQYEQAETKKADRDMKLLKKGVAVVKKGDTVEKVKLSPVIVKGVDVVSEEKAKDDVRGPDRNELAQKYLKQLKAHPTVGSPFHSLPLPKKLLEPVRTDLNAKAQKYLKALEAEHKKPLARSNHVDRNQLAQKYLHKLSTGKAPAKSSK